MVDKVYNPQSVPVYIGLFATDPDGARKDILAHSKYALDRLRENFPDDDADISQEHDTLGKNGMNFPQSVHITSLFIGKNKDLTNNICYKSFVENKSLSIEVTCVAYVPGQIICIDYLFTFRRNVFSGLK